MAYSKDDKKTSLGNSFFSPQEPTEADAKRTADKIQGLVDKIDKVIAMKGQNTQGQILAGPDYNKDANTVLITCKEGIETAVKNEIPTPEAKSTLAPIEETKTSVADLKVQNQQSSTDDVKVEHKPSSFKI